MKIGFFTDCYLPTGSGFDISVETFRRNLEKKRHKVYIFAPYYKGYKDKNPRVFRYRGIKVVKKPEIYLASPLPQVNSFKEFEKILKIKLDIVHSHSPFTLGVLGKYVASRQKIPIVYTHHTQYPEYAKFYFKEKFLIPYLARTITKWFANVSDAIIAPSFKIKKMLLKNRVKKPINIIQTGINLDVFKKPSIKEKIRLKKKLKLPPKAKILIFVGRMGKEKNIEFLLSVFKEIFKKTKSKTYLLMVGDGQSLEEFRQLSKTLKIDSFVKFTGLVPYEKIPEYYKAADIFVFSSLTDTQGLVILEAMASGLPVIALKDDAFSKIIINGKNGFLINLSDNKKEQNIFAQKVLTIVNDNLLYKKLSNFSRQTARQFSEEKQTKKLLAVYQKLIGT